MPELPADPTSFVGRDTEVADLLALLRRSRVVTVTGTAGVGKTRLAMRAAQEARAGYADGVCVAELSALSDPRLLPHTVAAALGLTGPSPMTHITGYLRGRSMLLVLDTCEHLVSACRDFATVLARQAPGITVLATSRQPLGSADEEVLAVSPLPVPDDGARPVPGDAVDLFTQRAASAVPGFTVTGDNRDAVIRLCRRLAGIPLAIELAAVRLRALDITQLSHGLTGPVLPLTGSRRTAVARHRELRTAIRWSYDLCTAEEQALWARISVFAGTLDLTAVTEVSTSGPGPDTRAADQPGSADTARLLDSLANKSVLIRDTADGGPPRYRMLDSLREFGAELLTASGAEAAVKSRFVARYLALARACEDNPMLGQITRQRALRREHDNIRAAIGYALAVPGNEGAAVRITTSLYQYWIISGLLREGEYWLNQVLERIPGRGLPRAQVLIVRALLLSQLGEGKAARTDAEAGIAIARAIGDENLAARGQVALHQVLTWSDELAEAATLAGEAAPVLLAAGDAFPLGNLDIAMAMSDLQARDPARCAVTCARGLARLPDGELLVRSYLLGLASVAQFLMGYHEQGVTGLRAVTAMKHDLGDVVGTAYAVGVLGMMAATQEQYERAAWLLGATGSLFEYSGRWYAGNPLFEEMHRRSVTQASGHLGEARWRLLSGRAAAAGMDEIVRLAIAVDRTPDGQGRQLSGPPEEDGPVPPDRPPPAAGSSSLAPSPP